LKKYSELLQIIKVFVGVNNRKVTEALSGENQKSHEFGVEEVILNILIKLSRLFIHL